jgi:hypothetical protein
MQAANKTKFPVSAKLFARELWEKPMDVIYKDKEFSIGIEKFKKEQREYEKKKKIARENEPKRKKNYKYKLKISKN